MAGCSGDESQFSGVLPLLALSQVSLYVEGVCGVPVFLCPECRVLKFLPSLFLRTSMGDLSFVLSSGGTLIFFFLFFKESVEDLFCVLNVECLNFSFFS